MTSKAFRSKSAKTGTSEDLPNRHIRFDYSDIYLDNEDLDHELEGQSFELRRQRYRKTVQNEENYKMAKQNADEMLQLKNALKNRDPNESSKRVSESAELKRRGSSRQLKVGVTGDKQRTVKSDSKYSTDDVDGELQSETKDFADAEPNEDISKPKSKINNLTMFLLSLQKLKGCGLRQKREQHDKHEDMTHNKDEQNTTQLQSRQNESRKRPSSYKSTLVHGGFPDKHIETDTKPRRASSQYGIHVKKDFTRSRRELEEISRIEQNAKYGYVNKYEERRKRLLDSCKNTDTLNDRIDVFLKDVDDFKKITSNVNSLERVLFRSRSAQISRTSTTFW